MRQVLVFDPRYNTRLPDFGIEKPFALDRGELVLKELAKDFSQAELQYLMPAPITDDDILLVHTPAYLKTLSQPETWLNIFEFKEDEYHPDQAIKPLPELLNDFKLKSGGTLLAATTCLKTGLAANLGGGYHHAFPDQGRGYCVIHDIAIAIRKLQKLGLVKRVLVVDLDFHQGDGTARIFKSDPSVYTLSVHSAEGWPEEKETSTQDVPVLASETHLYLEKTQEAIEKALRAFAPDMVLYVAGSDPYEKDVLPGTAYINLSLEEMRARDEFVIDTFANKGIPLASVFAGGYGPHVWEVHYWSTRRLLERSRSFATNTIPTGR
jgi:acetoin utilization deacetylase AcuC-like enzyme